MMKLKSVNVQKHFLHLFMRWKVECFCFVCLRKEIFTKIFSYFQDRYRLVPYPSCSLRLFSLQIDLLDSFLKKLKFVLINDQFDSDPLSKEFCSILNSIVYVADVLQQWKTRPVSFFF